MSGSLIVEGVLAALILAALGYCAMLEQRLRALKRDQTSLNGTVRAINGAIAAARANLASLRGSATHTVELITTHVGEARALADELTLLISVGEGIAQRIEAGGMNIPLLQPEAPAPAGPQETPAEDEADAGAEKISRAV